MVSPHHEQAVEQKKAADQVKDVEWSENWRIGLQKFPDETLQRVPAYKKIEALSHHGLVAPRNLAQIDEQEGEHREGFVELYGVAMDAVAEIDAPGQVCRRAVG